jgi:MFS family permease
MGRWADKYGHATFFTIGFGGMAVSLALLLFAPPFSGALFIAAFLGLSCAAVFPAWNALLSRFVPAEQQGTGWGVLSSLEGVGLMAGPAAGGWIADRFGAETTVTVSAAILLAIALLYWVKPVKSDGTERRFSGGKP